MRCYNEHVDFELDSLGHDAYLTGCPLCGDNCWDRKDRTAIDREIEDYYNNEPPEFP